MLPCKLKKLLGTHQAARRVAMRTRAGIAAEAFHAYAHGLQSGRQHRLCRAEDRAGHARRFRCFSTADKVDAKPGVTLLRQPVGTAKLQTEGADGKVLLCHVVVKKNRITTVTVSPLERPPRCQCERAERRRRREPHVYWLEVRSRSSSG